MRIATTLRGTAPGLRPQNLKLRPSPTPSRCLSACAGILDDSFEREVNGERARPHVRKMWVDVCPHRRWWLTLMHLVVDVHQAPEGAASADTGVCRYDECRIGTVVILPEVAPALKVLEVSHVSIKTLDTLVSL